MLTIDINNNINDDDKGLYFPIPQNEDLNFTEEEHRQFSREVATQSIVLAINNGLPIESKDQVVLFGKGTNDTICGPINGESVYKQGTSTPITPVMIVEGFENKIKENKNKFIYIKNEKGYEIGLSGIDPNKTLTEDDIKLFSNKIQR
jgi:beta-glucosidase-like glycosyl hydrolase